MDTISNTSTLDTIATATLAQSFPHHSGLLEQVESKSSLPGSKFILKRQTSSSKESILQNGLQKEVHVVVKNTPFTVTLSSSSSLLDFKHVSFDVNLVYDNYERKPVGFVKAKPLEVKQQINDRGDEVTFTTKLKVLTSQHEDMFFRLLIIGIERSTGSTFNPSLQIYSDPIKVISKPKQPKKRRRTTKKKSINETLFELMQQIEGNQRLHTQTMHQLLMNKGTTGVISSIDGGGSGGNTLSSSGSKIPSAISPNPSMRAAAAVLPTLSSPNTLVGSSGIASPHPSSSFVHISDISYSVHHPPTPSPTPTPSLPVVGTTTMTTSSLYSSSSSSSSITTTTTTPIVVDPLIRAVKRFITAYNQLPVTEKPTQIHRIMRQTSAREAESLAELLHHLLSAPRISTKKKDDKSGCACEICPHMLELERIDSFYTEFLMTPVFTETGGLGGFPSLLE